jgi:hypothetical protein
MEKEEILKKIKKALRNPTPGNNMMGASESYYNAYFMVGKCFTEEELAKLDEAELNRLIKLADFASEVFY